MHVEIPIPIPVSIHIWVERSDGKPMQVYDYIIIVMTLAFCCALAGVGTYITVRFLRGRK